MATRQSGFSRTVKVAAYDPGRIRDSFFMLAARVSREHIDLLNGREWLNQDFTIIADDIARIARKSRIDIHVCEANNQGYPAIDMLRRLHGIEAEPVVTVAKLDSKDKMLEGRRMPKETTVEWVEWARQQGIVRYPKTLTKALKTLDTQMQNYVRHTTLSGTKYASATEEEHDDAVATLLVLCHYARIHLLQLGQPLHNPIAVRRHPNALDLIKTTREQAQENVLKRLKNRIPTIDTSAAKIDVKMPRPDDDGIIVSRFQRAKVRGTLGGHAGGWIYDD